MRTLVARLKARLRFRSELTSFLVFPVCGYSFGSIIVKLVFRWLIKVFPIGQIQRFGGEVRLKFSRIQPQQTSMNSHTDLVASIYGIRDWTINQRLAPNALTFTRSCGKTTLLLLSWSSMILPKTPLSSLTETASMIPGQSNSGRAGFI